MPTFMPGRPSSGAAASSGDARAEQRATPAGRGWKERVGEALVDNIVVGVAAMVMIRRRDLWRVGEGRPLCRSALRRGCKERICGRNQR